MIVTQGGLTCVTMRTPALLSTLAMMPGTWRGSVAGLPALGGCNSDTHHAQTPSYLNFYCNLCSPICKTRGQQVPALHSPQLGPTLPAPLLGEPVLTVPAAAWAGPRPTQWGSLG